MSFLFHCSDYATIIGAIKSVLLEGVYEDEPEILSLAGLVIERLLLSPIGIPSHMTDGVIVTVDTPFNRFPGINLFRRAVLRQYYGKDITANETSSGSTDGRFSVMRWLYGTGTGRGTVGTPKRQVHLLFHSLRNDVIFLEIFFMCK